MNQNRNYENKKPKNLFLSASIFSRLSFWWLRDIFTIGWNRQIVEEDVYETLEQHKCDGILALFDKYWKEELAKKNPSLFRVLYRAYGNKMMFWSLLFSFLETSNRIAQPLFLGELLSYFSDDEKSGEKRDAYLYATGIIVCALIPVLTFHPFILFIFNIAMKIRIGVSALIYQKSLNLQKSTTSDGLHGRIINLLSNDVGKFDIALAFLHDLWKGPVECILLGYFIYIEIGIAGLIGMAFLLSFIPLQAWVGKKTASYRLQATKRTDERVKFMNEIIQGIQVIKMYVWENSFAKMIEKIRLKEMSAIRKGAYVRAGLLSFFVVSRVSIFISLMTYTLLGNFITAKKVYIVTTYFTILNDSMVHFWPWAITSTAEGYISVKRAQEFLLIPESDSKAVNSSKADPEPTENNDKVGILMKNATATWKVDENSSTTGIESISLELRPGKLCVIIGQVGCGKSTLMNVMIDEKQLDSGYISVNGVVSYAAQEAWLFGASIKRNILFVEEYDEKRYNEVIHICALERDFELFKHGDETIVGERGVSLSGGQKARVNLARAIYKQADIYILDDPLSAVDTHVGKHIFEKCIRDYLHDKVCVLVTHQLQYLNNSQHIVLMNSGAIEIQGSFNEVKNCKTDKFLHTILEVPNPEAEEADQEVKIFGTKGPNKPVYEKQVEEKEGQEVGSVDLSVYKTYFQSVDSLFWIFCVFFFIIVAQIMVSGVDYFVAQWVNWEQSVTERNLSVTENYLMAYVNVSNNSSDSSNSTNYLQNEDVSSTRERYLLVYIIIIVIFILAIIQRTFSFFYICLRISRNLHDKIFRGISRATMYFFNTNPSGRILNRFSKDIGAIDCALPQSLFDCIVYFLEMIAVVVLVSIVNYWFLIPTAIITILMLFLRKIYVSTSRAVKRIESLSKSPIFSHTNATLQGLSTIRAFKAQKVLIEEFSQYMDVNSSAWFISLTTNRAFALYLDFICVIYVAIITMTLLLLAENSESGNVGLAITQSMSLVFMCQWAMRQSAELENQMVSVERVVEYTKLPTEPSMETDDKYKPSNEWPKLGAIKFNNLNLRYSEKSELVLQDINFGVESQEKIGIVGRSGAGKSSIIQALFRLAPFEGVIEIDGIDTKTLGLKDLRSKVSIIPQDPVLFSGTLRSNLDPFEEHVDTDLWSALDQVELKQTISEYPGGLVCRVADGGSNFSMGERQLVCLARAILRKNNILVLDEATANVDPETDKLIQMTIKTKFKHCTVITIAHRLHTVMDNDRVLVMSAGQLVEIGHPFELLQNLTGYLRGLVDQTGSTTAETLIKIAEENYKKREIIM